MTGDLKDRPYMETLLKRIEEEEKVDIGKNITYNEKTIRLMSL